jgi:hypothetical protein
LIDRSLALDGDDPGRREPLQRAIDPAGLGRARQDGAGAISRHFAPQSQEIQHQLHGTGHAAP